jgi:hypothetical protein
MPAKASGAKKAAAKKAAKKHLENAGRTTPRKQDPTFSDDEITDISEFKKDLLGVVMQLPSGRKMKIRNPGMSAFLSAGIIPNALLPIVQEGMKKGEINEKQLEQQALTDPTILADVQKLADNVATFCITMPKVHPIPTTEDGSVVGFADRDQTKLYVDEISLEDKMFIFQYAVGGTRDLESFRKELA